ncbi:hypothetical protein ABZV93_00570 [Actinopolymorpha sp. NPDC004070]|uniref:arsenate reductase/protein-tyrosine-phosphatase family protein n=1 Tax=Actinopolymorpha sp. NPDC004070 TaxID=3154548 RepID=UPI0033AB7332
MAAASADILHHPTGALWSKPGFEPPWRLSGGGGTPAARRGVTDGWGNIGRSRRLGGRRSAVTGVLHVCTANQIRSPIAERLMWAGLWRRFGPASNEVPVTSAGTRATAGQRIHPYAAAELRQRGVPSDNAVSSALDLGVVAHADLILTATRKHRDEVVSLVPSALDRTFTWRELAWLVRTLDPLPVQGRSLEERVSNLARVARGRRGHSQPAAPDLFDVADPIGKRKKDYTRAADEIDEAIAAILAVI